MVSDDTGASNDNHSIFLEYLTHLLSFFSQPNLEIKRNSSGDGFSGGGQRVWFPPPEGAIHRPGAQA
jgi:hypothetical protein